MAAVEWVKSLSRRLDIFKIGFGDGVGSYEVVLALAYEKWNIKFARQGNRA